MTVLQVPPPEPRPSLGDLVAAWMEASLVHGPGDLLASPTDSTSGSEHASGGKTMSS